MTKTNANFGINDLSSQRDAGACPIKGCNGTITTKGRFSICSEHGLEIHKTTYVYYNGDSPEEKIQARLRNLLPFGQEFAKNHILNNRDKAETGRLGSENSEDALTWNIFGGLLYYHRLHIFYNILTGEKVNQNQLRLFLWGLEIDFDAQSARQWHRLKETREKLEPDIKHFATEPDIMILGPTHLICIEAKFTSGNPIAINKESPQGTKPTSREGLIDRYIRNNKIWKIPIIRPEDVGENVHSQLFRMLVFTSAIAQLENRDWIVANLVSRTQWVNKHNNTAACDFTDPTLSIPMSVKSHFRFIFWEDDIYEKILRKDNELKELSKYMREKTANLDKAFEVV